MLFSNFLHDYLNSKNQQWHEFIDSISLYDPRISEHIQEMYQKCCIHPLQIFPERASKTKERRLVQSLFPDFYHREQVERAVYTFKIPFTGDKQLFGYHGTRFNMNPPSGRVYADHIEIEVVDYFDNASKVSDEYKSIIDGIEWYIDEINVGVNQFNKSLTESVGQTVNDKLNSLIERRKEEVSLGLPPDEEEVSKSIEIPLLPIPQIEIDTQHLDFIHKNELNYALSELMFNNIIDSLKRTSESMEKHYSTYVTFNEPNIRDVLLAMLDGMLSVRTTGETFNAKGKTDILLPFKQYNVFIAECKIWKGEKKFIEGLSQLEGYLGWDDAKAAYLIFYRKKDGLTEKIKEMRELIRKQINFVKDFSETDRGGRFTLKHPTDSSKIYMLELIVYHLPVDETEGTDDE